MRNRLATTLMTVALVSISGSMTDGLQTQALSCLVSTANGAVQGTLRGVSCAFTGVPYGAAPVGTLRWRPPQAAPPWAPATLSAVTASSCPAFSVATGLPAGSEDCLKLNIWTPEPLPASPAPVIVWIHPGAFVAASANLAAANGQHFAEQTGAVVVAVNYRLGPFGFLAHSALAAEDPAYPSSGNWGLLDQRLALLWIRNHIAAFGGDPQRITIAGSSAGALSVGLHLVSPGSTGLFDRAIMQSGPPSYRWRNRDEAEAQGEDFAGALGCGQSSDVLGCMRAHTRDQVLKALPIGMDQVTEGARVQWGPVVDGLELPDQPRALFEGGAIARVPLLLGTNRDEGWVFVDRSFPADLTAEQYDAVLANEFGADAGAIQSMYGAIEAGAPGLVARKSALAQIVGDAEYVCETRRVARLVERTGTPVFSYTFDYAVDAVAGDRSIHGMEVNLLFGNDFGAPSVHALDDADRELFRAMAGYWARFAARGDPNALDDTTVHWPAFKHPTGQGRGADKHLVIGVPISDGMRLRESACDFWDAYDLRTLTGAVPASAP